MIQTYNGRIEAGHFYSIDGVTVPDCLSAVLVLENAPQDISRRQAEAMRRFREEIRNNDEPVPEFERVKFKELEI
ncbi:MAG: hypothetical protein LBC70_01885 [Chitinispirillales bacterium]|jgi:hypothetical protein|nr:hypothetical protein [Chitinispirillales bacterium]